MRLIHAETLQMKEFPDNAIPPYAILSHTWGLLEEEMSFEDMEKPVRPKKKGLEKIEHCCREAWAEGIEYVWVDTCCICKSSSAELSEAINSMYKWYSGAKVCYAYLDDVEFDGVLDGSNEGIERLEMAFEKAKWFTRGWTLQELLAPAHVRFFISGWTQVGHKSDPMLCTLISAISVIDEEFLLGASLTKASVATRMSWASNRITTRVEDTAYCLLGIFDVNMALLYGEGEKAFIRLQEEIMKDNDDQSLFAWGEIILAKSRGRIASELQLFPVLASSPAAFFGSKDVFSYQTRGDEPYSMTNKGLRLTLPVLNEDDVHSFVFLNCHLRGDLHHVLGILIAKDLESPYSEQRLRAKYLFDFPLEWCKEAVAETMYFAKKLGVKGENLPSGSLLLPSRDKWEVSEVHPIEQWDRMQQLVKPGMDDWQASILFFTGTSRKRMGQKYLMVTFGAPSALSNDIRSQNITPRPWCAVTGPVGEADLASIWAPESSSGNRRSVAQSSIFRARVRDETIAGSKMFVLEIQEIRNSNHDGWESTSEDSLPHENSDGESDSGEDYESE